MRYLLPLLSAFCGSGVLAADQPQWGQAWTRNMVSGETGLPKTFDVKTGKNIKWVARLGSQSYSTPIVARGRVYVGANNDEPRDPKHLGDRGVFMCFDEQTGELFPFWAVVSANTLAAACSMRALSCGVRSTSAAT